MGSRLGFDAPKPRPERLYPWPYLIPALADRFHVLSPDYPGFGNTDMPEPRSFPYTFDHLSGVVEGLLAKTGFTRAGFFMQDYGGPWGFGFSIDGRSGWNG
jgi:pimeloyl-ACP methyl ester carboxylesterase